jgi:Ca-activated chloride channel homolog
MRSFRATSRGAPWARLLIAVLLVIGRAGATAQGNPSSSDGVESPSIRMNVDEVVVTFNAIDANGSPVNDLKAGEIRIRDNAVAPKRIFEFDNLVNRSIRVGILLDTSESMRKALPGNKAIAAKFLDRFFRQNADAAFVSSFGSNSDSLQSWTGDLLRLEEGVQMAREQETKGTALFNALFQMCSSSFNRADPTETGNFILLFSDGEDNAGLTLLDDAARACQRTNTAVFAFLPAGTEDRTSTGPRTLRELAAKTGGSVFLSMILPLRF